MMNKTDIEYLDYTWNITHGCSAISPGCDNCWAKATSKRLAGMGMWGYPKENPFAVTCCPWKLDEPLKVKKPSRIGVSFMGDLFHEDVPDEFISEVFDVMGRQATQHQYIVLTKRSDRMKDWTNKVFGENDPYPNIIGMVTAENQDQADKRIPDLLQSRFAIRGVSIEPMLGPISFRWASWQPYKPGQEATHHLEGLKRLDWVIVGAESGARARYCDPKWMINIVDQCKSAEVPVFVKQVHTVRVGSKAIISKNMDEWPEDLQIREYPT